MIRCRRWIVGLVIVCAVVAALLMATRRSPFARRLINRPAKDFATKIDLSTPESLTAVFLRTFSQRDIAALNELSWMRYDPDRTRKIGESLKPSRGSRESFHAQEGRYRFTTLFNTAEICEVLTYQDDLAAVVFRSKTCPQFPYDGLACGRIDGTWKSLTPSMHGGWTTLREAEKYFETKKDRLWKYFERIRDDARTGRDLTLKGNHDSDANEDP